MSEETPKRRIGWPWLVIHVAIILNFAVEIFYASYVLFVVLAPEGGGGPLWAKAAEVDMDLMMRRRLYATEAWIAIAGMSVYLAISISISLLMNWYNKRIALIER